MKIFKRIISIPVLIIVMILLVNCKGKSNDNSEELMVFAAASLVDVITELSDSYETDIKLNLASSGTLARQIEQGADPDLYISASKKWADYVLSIGGFYDDKTELIAKNELVVIVPGNSSLQKFIIDKELDFISLLSDGRLSIGDPAHVPAGKYAMEALTFYGWDKLLDDRILPAKDVRSALMVVELEESPLGIVYRTDALKSAKVRILSEFPGESHSQVVYIGGVCKASEAADEFLSYILSDETTKIWEKYGFTR